MRAFAAALVVVLCAACGSSSTKGRSVGSPSPSTSPLSSVSVPTPSTPAVNASACGNPGTPPQQYRSVVVFSFENRTWDAVGGVGFGPKMPYLHALGARCAAFAEWREADGQQNSLTQYVAQITGAPQAGVFNDCGPSSNCSTTADNLFRQVRAGGRRAVDYVEGATKPCSASGNASKHVPALYLRAPQDRAACEQEVRPYSEFDPAGLPAFAFVTPTLCNDGHDCDNATVDRWARANMQRVLDSAAYQRGEVAVFVWYDEDRPVPNLWITPTAQSGTVELANAGYAGTLAAWESMLGLPCLANACNAPDMRTAAHS